MNCNHKEYLYGLCSGYINFRYSLSFWFLFLYRGQMKWNTNELYGALKLCGNPLPQHILLTSTIFSSFFHLPSPKADWYMQKWHLLEFRLPQSVWCSFLNTYPQSFSRNHHEKYMEELSISWGLKKLKRLTGNSARNAHSRMLEKIDMKVGQWSFCKIFT